ncbi:MAG: dCMP deaminase family protein [Candidatus Pacebacteria bacterium]|nr:dCMP deaminase family protein [Candidatus Paceibacterota bacterium]MBP9839516.1 dCMP deaminase family protein [Candidatus Paceibacterota bacterium]
MKKVNKNKTLPRKAISWDECFMRMAHVISERSKDPSTQAGAVVVDAMNVVVGVGYNGFPRGIQNDDLPWDKSGELDETKYAYVCHAEENAIYNANNSTKGCKIYCTLFPCNECAKTLIQNGIKEVIYESDKYANTPIVRASKKMFQLTKIKVRQFKSK